MRIILALLLITSCLSCSDLSSREKPISDKADNQSAQKSEADESKTQWKTYSNGDFSLKYPQNWQVLEQGGEKYPKQISVVMDTVNKNELSSFQIHAKAAQSFVSFFPKGYGTELPSGRSRKLVPQNHSLKLNLALHEEKSQIFLLENDTAWAYLLYPSHTPSGWSEEAFIFAQIGVNDFKAECIGEESGKKLSMKDCDPLMGDRILRFGDLKEYKAEVIIQILQSIEFTGSQERTSRKIAIHSPKTNSEIISPLHISGKARGSWFFEGSFPVRLVTANGKELSAGVASATENWMTEEWVPFEVKLDFTNPQAEKGAIIFEKANPSGLPKNSDSYRQEVLLEKGN